MILTLQNTICRVNGTAEEQLWLQNALTIETGEMSFSKEPATESFFRLGQGFFPVGLIDKVLLADAPESIQITVEDERTTLIVPEIKELSGFQYYPFQKDAIQAILQRKQGLIQVATNGGKTAIMAGLLKTLEEQGIRGVIITHSQEIYPQLVETFKANVTSVGEIKSEKIDVAGRQFIVAMAKTLLNRLGDDPDVTDLYEEHQILLADEGHHLTSDTWKNLLRMSNARIKVGFSGTIPDEDSYTGWRVRSYTGPVLIDVRNKELIDSGISAKPKIKVFVHDSTEIAKPLYKECMRDWMKDNGPLFRGGGRWVNNLVRMKFFGFYQRTVIEKCIAHNLGRNTRIVHEVLERSESQTLIIVERIAHGEELLKLLTKVGADVRFAHGSAKDRKESVSRFKSGDLRVLVSTQILDEGVDISGISLLVLAGGMKCKRALLQRIGRGLRKKASGENVVHIMDFADLGNRYLEDYTKARQAIYKDEQFDVEMVLDN